MSVRAASEGKVFLNNRTQSVRIPVSARFDKGVDRVRVRVVGQDRILSPVESTWDSFFTENEGVTSDFMSGYTTQKQENRG